MLVVCKFAKDEKSLQIFELVTNIIKKNYLLIEFGERNAHGWLQDSRFASICSDYRIIMQEASRYKHKLADLLDVLDKQLTEVRSGDHRVEDKPPDVLISYCWENSLDAVSKGTRTPNRETSLGWMDPRRLAAFLNENGVRAWLDVNEVSGGAGAGLFDAITQAMNKASVVVCCFSDEYVRSRNCVLEFRFAHVSLRRPIFKALVGQSNVWRQHELAFLAGSYPEINFQTENQSKIRV